MMKAYQKLVFEMIDFSANDVVRTSTFADQAEATVLIADGWDARTNFD